MTSRRAKLNAARVLAAVGALFTTAWVSLVWGAAHYTGVQYRCLVGGPFRDSPPYALVSEAVQVRGSFSWIPLGRTCSWERADGLGFVTALPDWSATIPAILGIGATVAGIAILIVLARRRQLVTHNETP